MMFIVLALVVILAVGVALILFTAEGSPSSRFRKVGKVTGVSLLASSVVFIVTGILAYALIAGIESSIEDAFAGDETYTSEEDVWADDEETWVCGTDDGMTEEEWAASECGFEAPLGVDCSTSEGHNANMVGGVEYPCLPGQDVNALSTLVNKPHDEDEVDWSLYCTNGEDDRLCGNDESDILNLTK